MRRSSGWLRLLWGITLALAGGSVLVLAAMLTVAVTEAGQKAGGIALAVVGVWLLSRGGSTLYGILLAR